MWLKERHWSPIFQQPPFLPTKATTAMNWSKPSKPARPLPISRREATESNSAPSIGIATRRATWSNVSSIASSSSVVSQLATTSCPAVSVLSCISLAPISGYCEHALVFSITIAMSFESSSKTPILITFSRPFNSASMANFFSSSLLYPETSCLRAALETR